MKLFSLEGRVAMITGCNKGLGQALAVALAQAGADIVGVSRSAADTTRGRVEALGRQFFGVTAELGRDKESDIVAHALTQAGQGVRAHHVHHVPALQRRVLQCVEEGQGCARLLRVVGGQRFHDVHPAGCRLQAGAVLADQRSDVGAVGGGGGRMTVNAPGDSFEQEADSVARTVSSVTGASLAAPAAVQREGMEEEEIQRQAMPEEDEVQRQPAEEDEAMAA